MIIGYFVITCRELEFVGNIRCITGSQDVFITKCCINYVLETQTCPPDREVVTIIIGLTGKC